VSTEEGIVVHKSSSDLRVETKAGTVRCSLRGKMRAGGDGRSPVLVGDRVEISVTGDGQGTLERILPRKSVLGRSTAGGRPVEIAANVDALLIVIAARDPPPRWGLVDRMLASAERDGLEALVCVNKWDQAASAPDAGDLVRACELYRGIGYPVLTVSALERQGIEELAARLRGKVTVLSGHSGVGKSTLLNALDPDLSLTTGDVNEVTGKGRHTTTAAALYRIPSGGHVIDTPGFREFLPADIPRTEIWLHFPEMASLGGGCRYKDCLHRGEPGCAVRQGVEEGKIARMRYESYLRILESLPGGRRSE
jgi:ribosome biogenesis GTPase